MAKAKKKSSTKKPVKKKNPGKKRASSSKFLKYFLLSVGAAVLILICCNYRTIFKKIPEYSILPEVIENLVSIRDKFLISSWAATLYFGDDDSDFLITEVHRISSAGSEESRIIALINELISGPSERSVRTIPEHTELISVKVSKTGLATVDFTRELSDDHPGGTSSELMTVFSIVNTVISNNKKINKVKILIDGKRVDTIGGHIDCRQTFTYNNKIVR